MILNSKGHEAAARTIRSYVEDGHSYHYGLDRWMISSDLIIDDEEEFAIHRAYTRLFGQGPVFIVAMLCPPLAGTTRYAAVHYGPEHGWWYEHWLDSDHGFATTDSLWFVPGTLTYAEC